MSAKTTVMSDPMVISGESQPPPSSQSEVELIICDCCSLTEECTPAYIERVRERYFGKWICGLCAEAIKDEIVRSKRLISTEEAMKIHINFCQNFKTADPPVDPTLHLILAMRQIMRRSLESKSTPSSPIRKQLQIQGPALTRSESCFPALTGCDL